MSSGKSYPASIGEDSSGWVKGGMNSPARSSKYLLASTCCSLHCTKSWWSKVCPISHTILLGIEGTDKCRRWVCLLVVPLMLGSTTALLLMKKIRRAFFLLSYPCGSEHNITYMLLPKNRLKQGTYHLLDMPIVPAYVFIQMLQYQGWS